MADQPPAGDASSIPMGEVPANFSPYIGVPSVGFGGGVMQGAEAAVSGGVLPALTFTGEGAAQTGTAKANEGIPGAGPMAGNIFDVPAGAAGTAGAEVPGVKPEGTFAKATDANTEIAKPQLTFGTDSTKANLLINDKGEFSWKDGKMPTKTDSEVKAYVDPKFAGAKDPAQISNIIDKANADLKAKGANVELQKPQDMATALKTVQEQQAKAATDAKKAQDGKKPGDKKPVPDGGGGGGGGGGTPPPKKDHDSNRDTNKHKDTSGKKESSDQPKSFEKMSSKISEDHTAPDGSHYKGAHPEIQKDATEAIYSRIPAYSQAGGIGDQMAAIDDDPNLTPEEKAAKKAALMAEFQKDHASEIKDATKSYGDELANAGLSDETSKTGFESIANSLTDTSKAGDIASLLSNKAQPGDTTGKMDERASKVFDSSAEHAIQDLALAKYPGANWKATSKADLEAAAPKQGQAAASIITGILPDGTPFKPFTSKKN